MSLTRPFVKFALAALAAAVLAPAPARGQDAPDGAGEPAKPDEPVPLWEIGAVAIAAWQPAYPGSDQDIGRLRVLPFGVYHGRVLRVDGNGVGLRGYRTPRVEWDVSATAAFGSRSSQVRARDGMPSIGTLVELGPALKINLGDFVQAASDPHTTRLEIPVRAVFDANDGFARHGWTFEPRLTHIAWTGGASSLVLGASTLFGDRALSHLYYGVDAPYATARRPAYRASAGLVATRLGASLRHRLTSTLRLQWFAQIETVRGAANEDSPLVRSKQDAGAGVSLVWGLWHSAETGID